MNSLARHFQFRDMISSVDSSLIRVKLLRKIHKYQEYYLTWKYIYIYTKNDVSNFILELTAYHCLRCGKSESRDNKMVCLFIEPGREKLSEFLLHH